ncbi:MAG: ABC transporter ATP-binding protein [Clostridia bacterium]|nr:ABC transporter ATP-binding protein [Clostridia bacterium]
MIQVKNLNYTYKKSSKHAVRGISFNIEKGEIFGFLGPSGAGKSTTQKILIKLLDGYSGDVKIFGKDLSSFDSNYYEKLGISFELPNHFSKLTAKENLEFFKSFYKNQRADIDGILKAVGLYDHKNDLVENFSKGMKMRLNFVRALLNDADIMFFDEPTSGLDPVNAKIIKDLILEQKNKNKTVFVTTHDMQVADTLCDRVAFIVDGEIVEIDTPKALKLKYGLKVVEIEYYVNGEIKSSTFDLASYGTNPEFLDIIKKYETRTIHSMETTLEDVFIKVTGRSLS